MEWLTDPFTYDFMQAALAAALLTGLTTALVGTWVVLRGMAFMGDALAHGVLPGLTLAYLLEVSLFVGATIAAVVVIGGVSFVQRRTRLRVDTGIGLLFVGMLALGVIIASKAQSYAGDLTAILFGDVLAVTGADIRVAAVAALAALALTVLLYRPFIALALNERQAAVLGLRPRLAHVALLALLAAAIIASFRAVGVLLVFGFLIAPPATATLVTRRVPVMMAAAAGFAAIGVLGGLLVSFHLGTAGSATMVGVTVAEFFLVLAGRELRDWIRASIAGSERVSRAVP
ncbi:zinc ABC transporter permease AztB [Amycolatopsis palatopharyngis]|uniref:zinc ABC transporter permease AztB n=1 Tax=Amycolatopsis palatopharyngis TaxID=187982 RepID=UPI001B8646F2|nr:zinc ABC transporter permease AztB [Amycolatopsis palatopharyngis]